MELLTIPVVTAIVQAFRMAGLPVRFAPILSVVIGLIIGTIFVEAVLTERLMVGLVIGLSASGLYSGGKTLLKK